MRTAKNVYKFCKTTSQFGIMFAYANVRLLGDCDVPVRVTVMQVTRSSKTLGNIIQLVDRPANDMFMLDGTLDR